MAVAPPSFLPGLERVAGRAAFTGSAGIRTISSGPLRAALPICPGQQGFAGEVDLITTPVPDSVVRLYDRSSGKLVREVVSDAAGLYAFPNVSDSRFYYLVALDLQPGGLSAAIADYVQPT